MKILSIDAHNPDPIAIAEAANVLRDGGIVAYPSDSSYGLACDPTNPEAMKRLFELKGRAKEKSISCNFASISEIATWTSVGDRERAILEKNLPGPFTFILAPSATSPVVEPTIGVRIPDHAVTMALSKAFGMPYTATSANISGQPSAYSRADLEKAFPNPKLQPDLMLDAGSLPQNPASAVVDLTTNPPTIKREGAIKPKL